MGVRWCSGTHSTCYTADLGLIPTVGRETNMINILRLQSYCFGAGLQLCRVTNDVAPISQTVNIPYMDPRHKHMEPLWNTVTKGLLPRPQGPRTKSD